MIKTMAPTASAMMAIQRRKSPTSLVPKVGVLCSTTFYGMPARLNPGVFSVEPV
ncbi:MAG: hypothetical protein WBD98_17435 [Acidobacteriaceae bacterium]